MRLRSRRRNLVIWSSSAPPGGYRASGLMRLTPGRRIRRRVGTGALFALAVLVGLVRAVPARWRLTLAGVVLTALGVMMRSGAGSAVYFPGILLLLSGLLAPVSPRSAPELERELAAVTTPAQRRDLEATLDRYPDGVTRVLRDILASQASAARNRRSAVAGR